MQPLYMLWELILPHEKCCFVRYPQWSCFSWRPLNQSCSTTDCSKNNLVSSDLKCFWCPSLYPSIECPQTNMSSVLLSRLWWPLWIMSHCEFPCIIYGRMMSKPLYGVANCLFCLFFRPFCFWKMSHKTVPTLTHDQSVLPPRAADRSQSSTLWIYVSYFPWVFRLLPFSRWCLCGWWAHPPVFLCECFHFQIKCTLHFFLHL